MNLRIFKWLHRTGKQGEKLYRVSDVVVYGCSEVCSVMRIGFPDFLDGGAEYYYLQPLCCKGTTLYVKTENPKKRIVRKIMSGPNAEKLLAEIPKLKSLYNEDERQRQKEYAEVLHSCEFEKWLQMWKGIKEEKRRRLAHVKKLGISDEQNLKKVEASLCAETAEIFQISIEQAGDRLNGALAEG
ncbi:hypothetical protein LQE92_03570 [Lacrimispora sp. NSJ-141]|uniref:CarD-like/TRCF RNAP-interacting domain-containing protein n=1 Tax=Lientehia hominis TaxID=2897778 RepID=A0AAP2RGF2_9FIRM|nr:CarD family transcriptional regulator [Lientehia hominis]MCD2491702.1 hypothetical protein [Lientehia hominis]